MILKQTPARSSQRRDYDIDTQGNHNREAALIREEKRLIASTINGGKSRCLQATLGPVDFEFETDPIDVQVKVRCCNTIAKIRAIILRYAPRQEPSFPPKVRYDWFIGSSRYFTTILRA